MWGSEGDFMLVTHREDAQSDILSVGYIHLSINRFQFGPIKILGLGVGGPILSSFKVRPE
jgi:hypothetical protein